MYVLFCDQKTTMFDLLFLIAIYSPKNNDNYPFEMRSYHHSSHLTITEVFPGLGPILTTGVTYRLTVQFLQIFLLIV